MKLGLIVDWENFWIECLGRCCPSYASPQAEQNERWVHQLRKFKGVSPLELPRRRFVCQQTQDALARAPSELVRAVERTTQHKVELKIATAIWQNVPLEPVLQLRNRLKSENWITSQPTIDIASAAPEHKKNASDYKLSLDIIRALVLSKAGSIGRQEKAELKNRLELDGIVLVSGDHIFVQLIDFFRDVLGLHVFVAAFEQSLSNPIKRKMGSKKFLGNFFLIDRMTEFRDLRLGLLELDPLQQHKMAQTPNQGELLKATVAKRLSDRSGRERGEVVREQLLIWIEQWLTYWNTECDINIIMTPQEALDLLVAQQVVALRRARSKDVVDLRFDMSVRELVMLGQARRFAFEHLYDTPPVHYSP